MAGLCAAISAKQSGASKVLLVEKGGFLGGHSILSGSGYWIGGTKIQKKPELMILWKLTGRIPLRED